MVEKLFQFLLDIPQVVANLGSFLVSPIYARWLNISPLGLLGIGGSAFILTIITVHVVKLFI